MEFDDKILKTSGYNKFTLLFADSKLESDFWVNYVNQNRTALRKGLFIGFFIVTIFACLEIYLDTSSHESAFALWYAYVTFIAFIPAFCAIYWLSFSEKFHKYYEFLLTAIIYLEGTSTLVSHYLSKGAFYLPSQHGLLIIFIYSFFVVRMRFRVTFWLCLTIFLEYLLVISLKNVEVTYMYIGSVSIFIGLLLTSFAGYFNEVLIRKNYLLISRINRENEQKVVENEQLEKEVKRRTLDLVLTNQALKKAMQKAESSDILKSTILANISHEIRTPLTRIVGFSELLTKGELPVEKKRQYSDIIEQSTNQLLSIVTNVIELSKIQSETFSTQNVTFFLHDLMDELHPFFEESCSKLTKTEKLLFNLAKDDAHRERLITTDLDKLKKVLHNLVHNAVKFTPAGQITVSYEFKNDGLIEFCVKDNGIGIDEENIEMIFESFRQEDEGSTRQYGGTGVGLSISKGIVTKLGGDIWVKSKKGEGSSFYFTIPLKGKES